MKDTYGRSFPGNPLESVNQQFVRCWNATDNNGTTPSVTVHIVDNCPAVQEKPEGLVSITRCSCRPTLWWIPTELCIALLAGHGSGKHSDPNLQSSESLEWKP